ncbi:MFS transporter [Acetobacteraceae bacterium KSS8]|uniref:MFS transporter n=1 Tax=Endosaccharibacter trunci TaxID=2812733 RepID=A0ABT1WC90_9PROT|nr:MFS transporter [Acetobacteraceae bacterium KSS8]
MSGPGERRGVATAFGAFLLTLVGPVPSLNATLGLFLRPVSQTLHGSRASVSVLLLMMAIATAMCLPSAGRLTDRFGARRVVLAGAVALPACVAVLSQLGQGAFASAVPRLLLFACLGIASALCGAPLLARLTAGWFFQRRGLVLGLVAGAGNGIGCVIMPALADWAIGSVGWREAYGVLAAAMLLVGLPAAVFLLRDPPSGEAPDLEAGLSRAEAMRTVDFWLILLILGLGAGSLAAIFTHVVPLLLDRGVGPGEALAVAATIALAGSAWQPVMGAVLDRTGEPRWLSACFLLALLGLLLLWNATGPLAPLCGGLLIGVAIGSDYAVVPLLASRLFGLRSFGEISASLFGVNAIVLGLTPVLADLGYGRTGSYRITIWAACACLLACAVLSLRLKPFKGCRTGGRRD